MIIAMYRSLQYNLERLDEVSSYMEDPKNGYMRLSEPLTIDIVPLPKAVLVQVELAALDDKELKAREALEEKLNRINERRAELQQLEYIPANKSNTFNDTIPF